MGMTADVARQLAGLRFEDLGQDAVDQAVRLVLDGLAVAVAGAGHEPVEVLWKVSRGLAGAGDASVIGHGASCAPDVAAYVNGAAVAGGVLLGLDETRMAHADGYCCKPYRRPDGHVGIDSFTDERRFAADMQDMLARIQVNQDDTIAGSFEEMHVTLEVELADGNRLNARCDRPRVMWARRSRRLTTCARSGTAFPGGLEYRTSTRSWRTACPWRPLKGSG
jgi:2-methylcitrate dehydratase PrpD